MADEITVEVVCGMPDRQTLVQLTLAAGSTIADAIAASRLQHEFPEIDFGRCEVGIWGTVATREQTLRNKDRVELYRPLEIDPREARRKLAQAGRSMGQKTG